jgi:putative metallohydrolase (TIGR04338 family)
MAKDMQRQKLYNAENECFGAHDGKTYTPYAIGEFDMPAVEAFVQSVTDSKYVRRKYGTYKIKLKDGRGCRMARGGPHTMTLTLPRWARYRWVVLHEIAHVLAPISPPPHSWQFAAIYLDLVRHFLGKDDEARLKQCFRKYKVRWRPKARRTLTPEQREAARERLVAARAARA